MAIEELEALEQTLSLVNARSTIAASMTILILEYFEHLELERTLVWTSKWNVCKCLFLASRYLPFGYVGLWLYYSSAPLSASPEDCRIVYNIASVLMILISLCADAVLYLRVHALSMHSKKMEVILAFNYAVIVLVCFSTIPFFLRGQSFIPSPGLLEFTGCFGISLRGPSHWVTACYAGLLYSSMLTMGLSLWYGVQLWLTLKPTPGGFILVKIFYIDGAFYFFFIAAMSTANILVAVFAPTQYRYVLSNPQAIAHSVLATRMILHLREVARVSMVGTTPDGPQRIARGGALSLSGFKVASNLEVGSSGSEET